MRSRRNRGTRWKTLNLILVVAVGLLILQHHLHLTPTGHKITLSLIVVVIYGSLGLWVKANAAALQALESEKYRKQSRDPAVYGTPEFPTRTQSHYQDVMSFYRRESPEKRERL